MAGQALVIGGAGFLGTGIVRELQEAGWRVTSLGRGNKLNRAAGVGFVRPHAGHEASFASRSPPYIHLLAGGKKLRYVGRVWSGDVMRAPPRNVICPLMNLPLYSPTAPDAGLKRG